MRAFFAHGFEGQPGGTKARYLYDVLGLDVVSPALFARGWGFEDQVSVILDHLDADPDLTLVVGSSMGGFAAAVAASRRPERPLRLVLLAPAVGLHRLWAERLGAEGMDTWRQMGTLLYRHQGVGRDIQIPWRMYAEAEAAAEVALSHPAIVIHGLDDDVVPMANSVALAQRSPGLRRLVLTPDGHRLLDSLPVMTEAVRLLSVEAAAG